MTKFSKALVALIMAITYFANEAFGAEFNLDEVTVTQIVSGVIVLLGALGVYQIPNSQKED